MNTEGKLEIARKLRISSKRFGKRHLDLKPIFKKCYRRYIIECIFKENDYFQLKIREKFIDDYREYRLKNFLKKNGFRISSKLISGAKKCITYIICRI